MIHAIHREWRLAAVRRHRAAPTRWDFDRSVAWHCFDVEICRDQIPPYIGTGKSGAEYRDATGAREGPDRRHRAARVAADHDDLSHRPVPTRVSDRPLRAPQARREARRHRPGLPVRAGDPPSRTRSAMSSTAISMDCP